MRYNIIKESSTRYERIVYEALKELHIPFKHRWRVDRFEIDFLLFDKICLEINGHEQDIEKNEILSSLGYVPIHLYNSEINKESVKQFIKSLNYGDDTIS